MTGGPGAPLANVTVTLTSAALINPQVQVTGQTGLFHFPTLPIGVYKLKFEVAGRATVERTDINIEAGFTADVNVVMTVGQNAVSSSQTQLVDQRSTSVQSNTSSAQLGNVGASRDIWSIMAVTPGSTIVGTVDVGGNQAGSQRSPANYGYGAGSHNNSAGSMYMQARNQLDGVSTTEGTASAGMYYDYGSVGELRQATASNDASMPVPGTFLNAVIKQGGDTTHAGIYIDYENPSFQSHNITPGLLQQGAGVGTRVTRYQDYDGDVGGHIIKSKLWYYISAREERLGATATGFPVEDPSMASAPANNTFLQNFTEKMTLKLKKNHRLTQFIQFNNKHMPNRNAGSTYWADATYNQDTPAWAGNLRYEGTITPKFNVTAMVANFGYQWQNKAWGAYDYDCAKLTNVTELPCVAGQISPRLYEVQSTDSEGGFPPYRYNRRRWIAQTDGRYFKDRFLGAAHEITFGYMWEREYEGSQQYGPLGQMYYWFNSPAGSPDFTTPYQVSLENGPTVAQDVERHQGVYVQDQIRIKRRAALTIGGRWDYYRNYEPNEVIRTDATFRAFYYAGAALPNGYSIPASHPDYLIPAKQTLYWPHQFAPRIGLAVDLTGKGTTFLKLHWGLYDSNPGAGFGIGTVNGLQYIGSAGTGVPTSGTAMTFKWSDPTGAPFNMNQLGAFVSGSLPAGATIAPNVKDPYMNEATAYLEKQFTKTISVRAGAVLRILYNPFQSFDLGRPYSMYTQPVTKYDPGPDGVTGTADDRGNITICCDIPTGTKLPVSQLQYGNGTTPEQYVGYEFTANKRMSNKWMLVGSYSWSSYHILYNGTPASPLQAYNNAEKASYWNASFRGSYQAPFGVVVAPVLRLMQGQPIDRILSLTGLNSGSFNLIADPYGAWRYPNLLVFDTRLEKRFKIKEKYNTGLFLDFYNLTNANTMITYSATTGRKTATVAGVQYPYALFGSPTSTLGPRIIRIGVKFSF